MKKKPPTLYFWSLCCHVLHNLYSLQTTTVHCMVWAVWWFVLYTTQCSTVIKGILNIYAWISVCFVSFFIECSLNFFFKTHFYKSFHPMYVRFWCMKYLNVVKHQWCSRHYVTKGSLYSDECNNRNRKLHMLTVKDEREIMHTVFMNLSQL